MDSISWEKYFEFAKQYYENNGDLLVPSQYITNQNIKLGTWIDRQRKAYKDQRLSSEKIKLLEKIDMVWSIFDLQWDKFYNYAVEYFNKNGNLLIPLKYTTDDEIHLGYWIGTQRKYYKEKKLSEERINLLEKIGMVWAAHDLQWYEFYDLAREYYKTNGNLLVPLRYRTKDNKQLGSWISQQRIKYKSNKISEEQIELLEKIGMAWDGMSAIWDEMYRIAKQYYEENGNLTISNTRVVYKNASLGSWIITQRYNYMDNRLTEKQIKMLNEIGMEWASTQNKDYIWNYNYNIVLEFYKKYKHLYIPTNYISKEGIRIGMWLFEQKTKYKQNKLSEYRKGKLDLLDKSWLEPSKSKSSFQEQAVLFYIKKTFPSATKLKTKEISEIDIYIPELKVGIEYDGPTHIRSVKKDIEKSNTCKKQGIKLIRIRDCECPMIEDTSYKIIIKNDSFEALDDGIRELLGLLEIFNTDVNVKRDYVEISDNYIKSIDLDWYNMYEKLVEYYNENGNINVPIYYKTSDGLSLGHWVSSLRNNVKKPSLKGIRLNSYKIELLEQLGIDWSPIETQWKKLYDLAEEYYKENGNLLIPDKYITEDKIKLGRWISTQRYNYKEKILPKEKMVLLEKIGMVWNVLDYQWKKAYCLAEKYYTDNQNLLVTNNYITSCGFCLGSWIGHQRKHYKDKKLSQEKIDMLERIGMVWDLRNNKL